VIFWVGLYPRPLLARSEATVRALLANAAAAAVQASARQGRQSLASPRAHPAGGQAGSARGGVAAGGTSP
jgi:hypothetical protein